MARVELTDPDIPDCSLEHDGQAYVFSITGLEGLVELPRFLRRDEEEAGIVSLDPPTVRARDARYLELLMARCLEIVVPPDLLETTLPADGRPARDKHTLMLAQVVRICRRALDRLEPPTL